MHQGLDFAVPKGPRFSPPNAGTVLLASPLYFEGNCVVLDHGQGLLTLYLHLSEIKVKPGERVQGGQEIGLSGGTGRATRTHICTWRCAGKGFTLIPQPCSALRATLKSKTQASPRTGWTLWRVTLCHPEIFRRPRVGITIGGASKFASSGFELAGADSLRAPRAIRAASV